MTFPLELNVAIHVEEGAERRLLNLYGGVTVLLGPNGSGKTHLMRTIKAQLQSVLGQTGSTGAPPVYKRVRFISAGRIGLLEQYRADFDGHRSGNLLYDKASYGSKDDASRRHNYETLQGDILTLSQRPDILIKVRERLRKLFQRDILVEWDAGSLKVSFIRLSRGHQVYSSGREASGLMHLVGLLTAIYDDDIGALLIDEPEVSLHPQLQAFLFNEMNDVAGYPDDSSNKKIFVLSTHSTEFIDLQKPTDLNKLIFCSGYSDAPVQISSNAAELKGRKIQELVGRMGQEHKLALFSRSPILVEGPSDALVCGALASKLKVHLDAGGSQILPVIGKGEFPAVVKLFRMMGKFPVVLADCDALADGVELAAAFLNTDKGLLAATLKGFGSGSELAKSVYGDFCTCVERHWDEIAVSASVHPYYRNGDSSDEGRRRRRAALAWLLSEPEEHVANLNGAWAAIRARLDVLTTTLAELGCYILRRGTIEEYYISNGNPPTPSKLGLAVNEALYIQGADTKTLMNSYADVINCLRFASAAKVINEGEALLDLLLACIAPLQARMKGGALAGDLNQIARTIVGDVAQVFDISLNDEKIVVNLKSRVLDVAGFPITVTADDNAVAVCSRMLLGR